MPRTNSRSAPPNLSTAVWASGLDLSPTLALPFHQSPELQEPLLASSSVGASFGIGYCVCGTRQQVGKAEEFSEVSGKHPKSQVEGPGRALEHGPEEPGLFLGSYDRHTYPATPNPTFIPISMLVRLVLASGITGMIEASAT